MAPWGWKVVFLMMSFEHILWKLLKSPCRWLEVYLIFALAKLTDKRDPMYYTSKRLSESHNDGHPKKIRVAILDFGKMGKKPLFSAELCSSSAHRQEGPHVLYIKTTIWVPQWWISQKKLGWPCWILEKRAKNQNTMIIPLGSLTSAI
jgi:hypothetical protein